MTWDWFMMEVAVALEAAASSSPSSGPHEIINCCDKFYVPLQEVELSILEELDLNGRVTDHFFRYGQDLHREVFQRRSRHQRHEHWHQKNPLNPSKEVTISGEEG